MWRILVLGLALTSCANSEEHPSRTKCEIGFATIESDTYQLSGATLESGPAELFYSYRPMSSTNPDAPLFVITVGGPGGAVLLLELDLSPLSTVGHLLFIDARNSGFSYDAGASSSPERTGRFAAADYNVLRDAADVAQVFLGFIDEHPEHLQRDVYFVAESYGGARSAVLLDLFLSASADSGGQRPFYSAALQERVERHLVERFGSVPPPEVVADSFRGQILLQPIIAGALQDEAAGELFEAPGSILDELAAQTGVTYRRCESQAASCDPFVNAHRFVASIQRSRYDYRASTAWLDNLLDRSSDAASTPSSLALTLGISNDDITRGFSSRAPGSFRFPEATESPRTVLDEALPELQPWDAYFVALHPELPSTFRGTDVVALDAHADASFLPALFVSNVRHTATLITRAEYDLHVFAPALPLVLERLDGVSDVTPTDPEGFRLTLDDGTSHVIDSPRFAASHAIGNDAPTELLSAISDFVQRDQERR